jgi:hypothetical protein
MPVHPAELLVSAGNQQLPYRVGQLLTRQHPTRTRRRQKPQPRLPQQVIGRRLPAAFFVSRTHAPPPELNGIGRVLRSSARPMTDLQLTFTSRTNRRRTAPSAATHRPPGYVAITSPPITSRKKNWNGSGSRLSTACVADPVRRCVSKSAHAQSGSRERNLASETRHPTQPPPPRSTTARSSRGAFFPYAASTTGAAATPTTNRTPASYLRGSSA